MAVAISSSCSSFHFSESHQEWPELNMTHSPHISSLNSVFVKKGIHSPTALHKIKDFTSDYFHNHTIDIEKRKKNTNALLNDFRTTSEALVTKNSINVPETNNGLLNSDTAQLQGTNKSDTVQTDVKHFSKMLNAKSKKSRRKLKKIRVKSTRGWNSLDLSECGFHISRFPKTETESGSNNITCEERKCDNCLIEEKRIENLSLVSTEESIAMMNALSQGVKSDMDDVSYFLDLGIDVTFCTEEEEVCESESNVFIASEKKLAIKETQPEKNSTLKKNLYSSEKCDAQLSYEEMVSHFYQEDLYYPINANHSSRKKMNTSKLFDLQCSSAKVYIRSDRHRRVEKAHKAVKSKNCKSLFNNKGRKPLYMHHRLIKMHKIDINFRNFTKNYPIPAMTKKCVAVDVAKHVNKANRLVGNSLTDAASPVQNLKHALHETNAPTHLGTDLTSFLISLQHREITPEDYEMLLRLNDTVKPKTVSNRLLSQLRTELIGPNGLECDDETLPLCTVCMEPYTAGQIRKFLPCSHYFHSNCIDTWLQNSSMNCPLDGLPVESS